MIKTINLLLEQIKHEEWRLKNVRADEKANRDERVITRYADKAKDIEGYIEELRHAVSVLKSSGPNTEGFKEVICPYYVINNDNERDAVLMIFRNAPDIIMKEYPYIIGKEENFIFQQKYEESIPDYPCKDEKKIYRYRKSFLPTQSKP